MATWHDWQSDLLFAAKVDITDASTRLLTMMETFSSKSCTNNPVSISHKTATSTNCVQVLLTRRAQNYSSHGEASGAFADQLRSGNYPNLLAAFVSGDPFGVSNPKPVADDLANWEPGISEAYLAAVQGASTTPGTPTSIHKGWEDVRRSVNHKVPGALRASDKQVAAALRALGRARKVRI
jgi:hypothetical protein